ncbi:MAG TPA: hypothetical protein VHB21_04400 [Minicystis sp.]|nr:hypothetical protein [Minicystis sp.]
MRLITSATAHTREEAEADAKRASLAAFLVDAGGDLVPEAPAR